MKKILFIIVCAELMIFYWAYLEVQKTDNIVYLKDDTPLQEAPPSPSNETATSTVKKAS
ncbi:hypothetical protein [Paenibacillus foliorum]|uniref:hypothetical protein n=1 Tax=Paenibacillus foliorum TaxID=2654974 RepID=UPI001490DB93|nr:hypothetical protein [Paenibacillus foliorum]